MLLFRTSFFHNGIFCSQVDNKQLKVFLTRTPSKDESANLKRAPRRKILKEKQISELLDDDQDDQVCFIFICSSGTVWPEWAIFKDLRNKFSSKSCLNIRGPLWAISKRLLFKIKRKLLWLFFGQLLENLTYLLFQHLDTLVRNRAK